MPAAVDLLRKGKHQEIWMKYCGFLDLSLKEFMDIQERLLMEQMDLVRKSKIGKKFIGDKAPRSIEEFREMIQVTSYEDYEGYFDVQREDVLPESAYLWARTSGRSGKMKWIPYTKQAYNRLGERVFAGVILAAARGKGDINLEEGDTLIYNTPPRPYISGVALRALAEHFNFKFIPSLEETENLEFGERISKGFQTALITGIDILGSLAVVLVKMGEQFAEGANTTKLSLELLHPAVIFRFIKALIRSKLEKRSMLPKDLWKIKAIPSGGMDTSIYKDKIEYYWGTAPYEQYGSTEEGAIAAQAWNKKGMTFFPDGAFLEFIPEEEWAIWRKDKNYIPRTVLLNEVELNKRYEVVITNFYGKPLLRYRMHDLIKFTSFDDPETGIKLPQMTFVGRSNDFIDLAGFTGLIDEKLVWNAILNSKIPYEEWSIRKEVKNGHPILHLYIESLNGYQPDEIQVAVHENLKKLNPSYADYGNMIGINTLEVTRLSHGTFQAYMAEMVKAGADMAHIKPPHMNASDDIINLLLEKDKEEI
ncbi:MAG: GH3 auxin-responsive promoter family protein [Anaerolineaceae bacterium]|nr:GH3 auxin-responsive promoter family protein [Anaerolineaceae bacterium]